MQPSVVVLDCLLDGDPAIRWQILRESLGAPKALWQAERARVETEGWGAALLARQDADGLWAGGAFVPAGSNRSAWKAEGQPWTATSFVLPDLRELDLDPVSEQARRTVALVGRHARWDHAGGVFLVGRGR